VEHIDPAAVYPTQTPKEISDADSFVASRSTDCSDRPPLPFQRYLVKDGMAKPLDKQTEEELEAALRKGTRRA
jgi:hypothetical protein